MRPTTRLARVTVYGGSALAVAALAFACSLQSDTTSPKAAPIAVTENQTFREFQVEKPAALLPGNTAPIYPQQLRTAGVEGKLLTRFVVDTNGRAIVETFKVVERTDDRFVPAVREAIPNLRFSPADVGGKKVKQLVEMPFEFMLSKDGPEGANASVEFNVRQVQPRKAEAQLQHRNSNEPEPRLPTGTYFEYQVERPALPLPSNSPPRYPSELRAANVEGEVMAQFIVNENGSVDSTTFTVVRAEQPEFVQAVRAALSSFRFSPALVGGRPVKQLVQMPFKFGLSK